jgi:mono/diheme cytochrome c family protein
MRPQRSGFWARSRAFGSGWTLAVWLALPGGAGAQERPYFITYNHQMEEPGSLEIALHPVYGTQRGGGSFIASWLELEYGARGWWTTELYLDGQETRGQGAVFSGFRWENRFRPLLREHRLNPVLYVELEDLNGADKTLLEVVGHDVAADHAVPNAESRRERKREVETKLILAGKLHDWDLAGNLIAEKNVAGGAWEFGYAIGASRPLGLAARPRPCTLCPENFTAGLEVYGGLGDAHGVGLRDTSHYAAPLISWSLPAGATLRLSPAFGLNRESHRFLLRCGISFEIPDVAGRVRSPAARAARDAPGPAGAPAGPVPQPAAAGSASQPMPAGPVPIPAPAGPAPQAAPAGPDPYLGEFDELLAGGKLFARHCAGCHGADGRGGRRGPSLATRTVREAPPADLFWFLTNGNLRRGMPAWSRLPEAQRRQLVTFLQGEAAAAAVRP